MAPADENVYEVGAVEDQPAAVEAGFVADSLIRYPVTPTLSVAVKRVIGTLSEFEVAGTEKPVTVGAVVSDELNVTVTEALRLAETFPAASLAHAYKVFAPAVATVYDVGAATVQPVAVAAGVADDSFTRYPVTPTLSDAARLVIGTTREEAVVGTVKAVTVGAVVSEATGENVIVIAAVRLADTLPAASLTQA